MTLSTMPPEEEQAIRGFFEKALERSKVQPLGVWSTGAGDALVLVVRGAPMIRAVLAAVKERGPDAGNAVGLPTHIIERNPQNVPQPSHQRPAVVPQGALVLFVVYDHPTDFPRSFVVRRQYVLEGGAVHVEPLPFAVEDTLERARAALPPGLHRIGRAPEDEPQIVETWL